ncbi:MAG: LPXTG cell wall anchor domain-containing protein, partial [Micrococcales bacterium]|nr:LPXTG cell wall anchor domain-containing protein [Micrococcales bacterium]
YAATKMPTAEPVIPSTQTPAESQEAVRYSSYVGAGQLPFTGKNAAVTIGLLVAGLTMVLAGAGLMVWRRKQKV